MKKTIFNSKNLLLNAILLSFLFLFAALLGATFFSYTVDASTSDDETFDNLNHSSNRNNFKNYRLPGQNDPAFPSENLESLNQPPMFEHESDDDPGVFTVPSRNYKFGVPFDDVNPRTANFLLPYDGISFSLPSSNRGTSQTSPEDANSINQGTDQSSSEKISLYEKATYPLNKQSLGSSALDHYANKYLDEVVADAQLYHSQDYNNGSGDKICPNCENLEGIHCVNIASLNPKWSRMLHNECSQTQQDYYIATYLSDFEDENNSASKKLEEILLQDYNEYYPISDFFGEQNKVKRNEERKDCLFKGKINELKNAAYEIHEVQDDGNVETVNISPAEYWEHQNEGAKKYLEFVTANTLAEEQFAFNKLYSKRKMTEKAWDNFTGLYE